MYHLESIYTGEYVDGVSAEDSEHSHVDVVLLRSIFGYLHVIMRECQKCAHKPKD